MLSLVTDLHGGVAGHVGAQDVPDEAGHDHPSGGAALAHLAVEHARRVGVGPLQLAQHRVKITFSRCLLVNNWHPDDHNDHNTFEYCHFSIGFYLA